MHAVQSNTIGCACTGFPRCSGSPRQMHSWELLLLQSDTQGAGSHLTLSVSMWSSDEGCDRRTLPAPGSVHTWPQSFASGDSRAEIFVNKCHEMGAKGVVAGDETAFTLLLFCNLSKELRGSIFCALILFLRWQFRHKSAISMAYSLQSSCLFPTPLFQANIQ